ncbi:MAG TPA: 50S ribosomal protein L6 [Candidatus Saccharimonadales bacterium]|nr:50S ribosomal protein L6 [Candidatus Saccharimonadales bacterium]
MSRVGKQPITVPANVTVAIDPESITVTGSKGALSQFTMPGVIVAQENNQIIVSRSSDEPKIRSKHGLMRALLDNMVKGVNEGFTKSLEINGVGYRVAMSGNVLKFNLGFSHDVTYKLPEGITATVEQNVINISGISRQQVGQVAAEIRSLKKPEPYKGKGIKYVGERIIRKSGKSGKEK